MTESAPTIDTATLGALEAFLFAEVGEEANGMRLTVVSTLGRLGIDPWTEARRLSELPRPVAAHRLAPMIGRVPGATWRPETAQAIAERLVQLLPADAAGAPAAAAAVARPASAAAWLICLVLLSAGLVVFTARGDLSVGRMLQAPPPPSAAATPNAR